MYLFGINGLNKIFFSAASAQLYLRENPALAHCLGEVLFLEAIRYNFMHVKFRSLITKVPLHLGIWH